MSYTTGVKVSVGDPVKDTSLSTMKTNWDELQSKFKFRGALVYINADQTILAGAAPQYISWNAALYDTDSFFSSGSPTLLNPPAGMSYLRMSFGSEVSARDRRMTFHIHTSPGTSFVGSAKFSSRFQNMFMETCVIQNPGVPFRVAAYELLGVATTLSANKTFFSMEAFK